jgi:hypothetical protein
VRVLLEEGIPLGEIYSNCICKPTRVDVRGLCFQSEFRQELLNGILMRGRMRSDEVGRPATPFLIYVSIPCKRALLACPSNINMK